MKKRMWRSMKGFLTIFAILLITQPAVASLEDRTYLNCMRKVNWKCEENYRCLKQHGKKCAIKSGKDTGALLDATNDLIYDLIAYFVIFSLLCGWCASSYAGKLRRNALFWFCAGCFLTWMAAVWLFLLGEKEKTHKENFSKPLGKDRNKTMSAGMKDG